jgi:hypothetical protein
MNLHPIPPNSKTTLLKKRKIHTRERGLCQNPPRAKIENENIKNRSLRKPVPRLTTMLT